MKPSPEALSDKNTLAFLHGTYITLFPFLPNGPARADPDARLEARNAC